MAKKQAELEQQTTFEDNSIEKLNDGGSVENVYTTEGVAEQGE